MPILGAGAASRVRVVPLPAQPVLPQTSGPGPLWGPGFGALRHSGAGPRAGTGRGRCCGAGTWMSGGLRAPKEPGPGAVYEGLGASLGSEAQTKPCPLLLSTRNQSAALWGLKTRLPWPQKGTWFWGAW